MEKSDLQATGKPLQPDSWKSGEAYHQYVGRWSSLVAAGFINWLQVPPHSRWLDVGCGTGALTRTILDMGSPTSVLGIDPSESHISFARSNVQDTRAAFSVGTAGAIQLPEESFGCIVSGLVLNFVSDPVGAISEMNRLIRKGGIIAAYVWDYADRMELIRYFWDTAVSLDNSAGALHEGKRFPLCRPDALKELFVHGDLQDVEVRSIDVPTRFGNFEDYWQPFLGGQGPAPGYAMSLSEERRKLLRDRIHATLPVAPDGSIDLVARAWAIQGRRK